MHQGMLYQSLYNELEKENDRLAAEVEKLQKELDEARELVTRRFEDLNKNGKTILDFYSVWLRQSRDRIDALSFEVENLNAAIEYRDNTLDAMKHNLTQLRDLVRVIVDNCPVQVLQDKDKLTKFREAIQKLKELLDGTNQTQL